MACRTGCPTQDHETLAACYKDTSFYTLLGASHDRNKAHDSELDKYRQARAQGIQPATTKKKDVDAAVALSNVVDRPFDASKGDFK